MDNQSQINSQKLDELSRMESKNSQDIGYLKENIRDVKTSIDKLEAGIKTDLTALGETMKKEYTSLDKFEPVKMLVFGLAGGVLVSVLVALLTVVIAPKFTVEAPPPQIVEKVVTQ